MSNLWDENEKEYKAGNFEVSKRKARLFCSIPYLTA
jgi:hypothetical protein